MERGLESLKRKFLSVFISMCLIFGFIPSMAAATPGATVYVSPATVGSGAAVGSEFSADLMIDEVKNLRAWEVEITVTNPSAVKIKSFAEREFLKRNGSATLPIGPTIASDGSKVNYSTAITDVKKPASTPSAGTLATITFQVVGTGTPEIKITYLELLDVNLNHISATTADGVFSQPSYSPAQPAQPAQSAQPSLDIGVPAQPAVPAVPAVPPAYGHLGGRVLSQSGNPIAGTAVRAGAQVVPTEPLTGEFRIPTLSTGIYTVYYDAPGYLSQIQEVIPIFADKKTDTPTVIMTLGAASGTTAGKLVSAGKQSPATIIGRVVNGQGRALRNVDVRIDATVLKTDRRGYFQFTQVVPGVYTIHYSIKGYVSQTQVMDIKSGKSDPPKVIMKRAGLQLSGLSRRIRGTVVAVSALPLSIKRAVEKCGRIVTGALHRIGLTS